MLAACCRALSVLAVACILACPSGDSQPPLSPVPRAVPRAAIAPDSMNAQLEGRELERLDIVEIEGVQLRFSAAWQVTKAPAHLFRYFLTHDEPASQLTLSVIDARTAQAARASLEDVATEQTAPPQRLSIHGLPAVIIHYQGTLGPDMRRVRFMVAAIAIDSQVLRIQGSYALDASESFVREIEAIVRSTQRAL